MNHKMHSTEQKKEYVKFGAIIGLVTVAAYIHADWRGLDIMQYLESFMGVFFLVFASFKVYRLKEFAYSIRTYATLEKSPLWWGYAYPFIQILFGVMYLFDLGSIFLDMLVLVWSAYGAYIVALTLRKKGDVHCLCLGGVIKLPLSTISFVEDLGMALMALFMLMLRL